MFSTMKKITPVIIPAITLQLIEFASMFIDAVMIGQYNPIALGATSLGSSLYFAFLTFFLGILLMTAPLIGQACGADNKKLIIRTVRSGAWLAIIFSAIILFIMAFITEICVLLNFAPETTAVVSEYVAGKKYSVLFLFALPFRFFLTSQSIFRAVTILSIMVLPINALLNWAFIFGKFGVPEMGVYGAGIATSIAVLISTIILLFIASSHAKKMEVDLWTRFWKIDVEICTRILKYGIWVGIALAIEMSLFTITNIYVAYFTLAEISAFAIMFQIWNIIFAVLIGLGDGLNIYTSQQAGKKNRPEIIRAIIVAIFAMISVNVLTLIIITFGSDQIFRFMLDTTSPNFNTIVNLIIPVLPIFILAIILESYVQLPTKLLQSFNDTKYIPIMQAVGYIIVTPSVAYYMSFINDYGLSGLYYGITAGITVSSILLIARTFYTLNHTRIFNRIETK